MITLYLGLLITIFHEPGIGVLQQAPTYVTREHGNRIYKDSPKGRFIKRKQTKMETRLFQVLKTNLF